MTTNDSKRANTLTITTTKDGWDAHFKLTHKEYPVIHSRDTGFIPDTATNATLQRETFRQYMMGHASDHGILWDPADKRTETNLMPSRYDTDALVAATAARILRPDLTEWLTKIKPELVLKDITMDDILPLAEYNGKAVSGKYSNGCWAYAMANMTATITCGNTEAYVVMPILLVSGQMKKPAKLGEGGYNMTSLRTELAKDFPELGQVTKATSEKTFKLAVGE